MRLTAIDIGTNTILMLIAELAPDGTLKMVRDEHGIARLGKGVDENRSIPEEAAWRALELLRRYKEISDECGSEAIVAYGTSVLRDAVNREQFARFIFERLGFEIGVLGGDEEAELTYLGAVSEFSQPGDERHFAVLDIGGGSTELTLGVGVAVQRRQSLSLGCVRLTERILKSSPPSSLAMNQALKEIRAQVSEFRSLPARTQLIGVAGTLTTLAALDLQLVEYNPLRVSGHVLAYDTIQQFFNHLRIKTVNEMLAYPQILPGRADVLLAGILILMEVMKRLNVDRITVSDHGLRYGIARREFLRKAWKAN
ncbi:MAG: Ppx/GppA family phosphatase [Ignavibacteria bacterium]|nr:Ppx/GppA family phosphatase [Ignavibacteria bacterium]